MSGQAVELSGEQLVTTGQRLRDSTAALGDRWVGWLVTIGITGFAFGLRMVGVAYPSRLLFDETYYPKQAWTLWQFGYEGTWPDRKIADPKIAAGEINIYTSEPDFAVHPPLGKWLIGLGEQWFGMNSFGWRFMAVVFGSLLILVTIRLARRLSRSTLIGGIAGVLLSLDGLAFVMSRLGLLDIFQAFFLVAAVSCVVADRDWYRGWLADQLEAAGLADLGGRFGPILWWRPWRLLAGICFGAAIAVKWNSLAVLAAMGLLSVAWDFGARRLAGARTQAWRSLLIDGVPAFVRLVVVATVVYLTSWSGWLLTSGGYGRDWAASHPGAWSTRLLGEAWASLWRLHRDIYEFHTGDYMAGETHTYQANPLGWLLMVRPTGIDVVNDIQAGTEGCPDGPDNCLRVISAIGTPVLWWIALAALVAGLVWWIGARDWRFAAPIIAALAVYLPWFSAGSRPLFTFYAICIIPFTVTVLALVLGLILGPSQGPHRKRGAIVVGTVLLVVTLNFAYLYPILTDQLLLYPQWLSRMWLGSWI